MGGPGKTVSKKLAGTAWRKSRRFLLFSDSQTRADALYRLLTQAVCSWSAWKKQMPPSAPLVFSCATPVRKLLYIADSIFLFLQSAYHGFRAR